MAFSNLFNYLKPGNTSSASENKDNSDDDVFHQVGCKPKIPKKVRQNEKEIGQGIWEIVDDDDDDVKVPIKRKVKKTKSKSSRSNISNKNSDGFYVFDDLADEKEESLLKKMENNEKHTYAIIKAKGNSVRVIQTDDPHAWENSDSSDDSFEVIKSNQKVDDKKLSSVIGNLNILDNDNAQLPLHLQPFYEPDKPKYPLLLHPHHFDSDSSSSIEVLGRWD